MADGEVKIDTKLDTDGLNEGLKDLKVKLNNLGVETEKSTKKEKEFNKELDKTADTADKAGKEVDKAAKKNKSLGDILKTVKDKINGTTIAGIAATAAIKKTVEVLNECAAAYKVQEKAELALQIAAKNNPYLNEESVYNLRNFASELQGMSEIGDEVSLQVMSQLAATGRTESEIIQIMSAAADMAAVTGQDIASAAQQLNATLTGNAGTLGRQIESIKNLTEEELKNGKAIEIIGKQYKGAAAEMADIGVQLSNAWGDFKENIGEGWQAVTQPVKQFFYDVITDINTATAQAKAVETARKETEAGRSNSSTAKILWEDAKKQLVERTAEFKRAAEILKLTDKEIKKTVEYTEYTTYATGGNPLGDFKKWQNEIVEAYKKEEAEVEKLKASYEGWLVIEEKQATAAEKKAKADQEAAAAAEKKAEQEAAAAAAVLERDRLRSEYDITIENAKKEIAVRREVGEEIDAQKEAQILYNTALSAYISMMNNPAFRGNSGNYKHEQNARKDIAAWGKAAKIENAPAEDELAAIITKNTAALDKQIESIKIRTEVMGKDLDYEELYTAYLDSYTNLLIASKGALDENNTAVKDRLDNISRLAQAVQKAKTEEEKLAKAKEAEAEAEELLAEIRKTENKTYYDEYIDRQNQLLEYQKKLAKLEVDNAVEVKRAKEEIDKEYVENRKQLYSNITNEVNGYIQQTAQVAQDAAQLMLENTQLTTSIEEAELEDRYSKGELAESEYYDKLKEIRRKGAQEEYKIKMFEWSASILAATANIAEGVSKAIAQGGTAGLITGALVGAAGAVQIASIIASKPVPPQFYAGGIIGGANGATYGSDNTYIHARTGEMVLNAHQQRSLWDKINGQDSRLQAGLNLTVNNTQANRIDADVREQDGEIFIDILDKHINKGFTDGTYDAGLAAMNTRQEGVRIL